MSLSLTDLPSSPKPKTSPQKAPKDPIQKPWQREISKNLPPASSPLPKNQGNETAEKLLHSLNRWTGNSWATHLTKYTIEVKNWLGSIEVQPPTQDSPSRVFATTKSTKKKQIVGTKSLSQNFS